MALLGAARGASVAYLLGNSLTVDCAPAAGLALLAADFRRYLFPQYQVRGGQGLNSLAQNPTLYEDLQGPLWNQGLQTRARRFLSCQPYNQDGSTLANDVSAIQAFSTLFLQANASGRILLYGPWPRIENNQSEYQTIYSGAVVDSPSTPTTLQRPYFDYLYRDVNALYPGQTFLVPIGEVINGIDVAARAGQIPDVPYVNLMYRDSPGIHMGQCGRFAAASTLLSVMFRRKTAASLATVNYYAALGGGSVTLTQAIAAQIEDIVWSTLKADARTGIN